jgi:predicted Rossmann fold nucleotide-binding protein DprA/Smf involved in DNA uptake
MTSPELGRVVSFTGHRQLPPGCHTAVEARLHQGARRLAAHGFQTGCSGMALGADTMWARAALAAHLKLWAHIPSPDQANRWTPAQRAEWRRLCALAWKVTPYGDRFETRLLFARNRGMLDACEHLIAVWDGRHRGGTYDTVKLANDRGLTGVHVLPLGVAPWFQVRRVHAGGWLLPMATTV